MSAIPFLNWEVTRYAGLAYAQGTDAPVRKGQPERTSMPSTGTSKRNDRFWSAAGRLAGTCCSCSGLGSVTVGLSGLCLCFLSKALGRQGSFLGHEGVST